MGLRPVPDHKMTNIQNTHPRKYGKGSRKCRVCASHHGLIRKYHMMICRQCFRESNRHRLPKAELSMQRLSSFRATSRNSVSKWSSGTGCIPSKQHLEKECDGLKK